MRSTGEIEIQRDSREKCELIFYERDESWVSGMQSIYDVILFEDPAIKNFLAKSLGIKVVVEKERRLLKLKNARIHLDRVKGLGKFLEFEVVSEGNEVGDAKLLEELKKLAVPSVVEKINKSYSDLLLAER